MIIPIIIFESSSQKGRVFIILCMAHLSYCYTQPITLFKPDKSHSISGLWSLVLRCYLWYTILGAKAFNLLITVYDYNQK